MTDETSTALRERPDRKRGRQPLSRRFCLSMDRARSLWRNTLGYLDGAFERRQSAHAGAAERALLQLNDYTLRDIGVKQEQLRGFAERAHGIRRVMRVNPRSVTIEDVEGIYKAAY